MSALITDCRRIQGYGQVYIEEARTEGFAVFRNTSTGRSWTVSKRRFPWLFNGS